ncbi:MAG: hypothetical protein AAF573_13530 [Bacteroidota bacterium]
MKKIFSLFLLVAFIPTLLLAQSRQFDTNDDSKGIVYNKEFTIDTRIHTYGFAIGANFTNIRSYHKSTYFQFELGELKHPKEFRQNSDNQILNRESPQSFILGKQNNLYVLRGGYGVKKYLSEKAKKKGVAIGLNYEAGVTLGLLKPYYLDIKQTDPNRPDIIPTEPERFNAENPCNFLDPVGRVYGASGFFRGLNEISVLPGVHAKAGVHFDWGAFDEFVKALEVGVAVDVFYKRAPILIHIDEDIAQRMDSSCPHLAPTQVEANPNRPFFINLYVTLHLGKRW